MEDLLLELNLERSDYIALDFSVETTIFTNTNAFCRKNLGFT